MCHLNTGTGCGLIVQLEQMGTSLTKMSSGWQHTLLQSLYVPFTINGAITDEQVPMVTNTPLLWQKLAFELCTDTFPGQDVQKLFSDGQRCQQCLWMSVIFELHLWLSLLIMCLLTRGFQCFPEPMYYHVGLNAVLPEGSYHKHLTLVFILVPYVLMILILMIWNPKFLAAACWETLSHRSESLPMCACERLSLLMMSPQSPYHHLWPVNQFTCGMSQSGVFEHSLSDPVSDRRGPNFLEMCCRYTTLSNLIVLKISEDDEI